MSGKDYKKLYRTQNKVLEALKPVLDNFYLTGGTALGRFYLNHRFSEDLDFFVNLDSGFKKKLNLIEKKLNSEFSLLREQTVVFDDFTRYFLDFDDSILKIEFINDVEYRCGDPLDYKFGLIDTPLNILANKLTAIVSRDEPKDIFDIYSIALNYSFNWVRVFDEAKKKAIINEIDIDRRIRDFPVGLMDRVDWFINPFDQNLFNHYMFVIANDFILGKNNSAGKDRIPIDNAVPLEHQT